MSDWTDHDTALFRRLAPIAVPRRREMLATLIAALPFGGDDRIRIVELGSGPGLLAEVLLEVFPAATLLALDRSASMRAATVDRLCRFGARVRVRPFELDTVTWWDAMVGADAVVSSLAVHHLNDAKKQYLYKAVADRLSPRGAFMTADLIQPLHPAAVALAAGAWDASAADAARSLGRAELHREFQQAGWNHFATPDPSDRPSAIFHHLVWLKHAGFAAADCVWLFAGHAVFGGYKSIERAGEPLDRDHVDRVVDDVLRRSTSTAGEQSSAARPPADS